MRSEIQWGVRYDDSKSVLLVPNEDHARREVEAHNSIDKTQWIRPFTMSVVSRTVTDWEVQP